MIRHAHRPHRIDYYENGRFDHVELPAVQPPHDEWDSVVERTVCGIPMECSFEVTCVCTASEREGCRRCGGTGKWILTR